MEIMGSRVVEELREHYSSVVGSEPEYHEMRTRSGESVGVFEWPKGTSRMGVHLYASAGASELGPGARQHGNRSEELFGFWEETGVKSWDLDRHLPAGIQGRPLLRWRPWSL
jgi:hypothetical protein